MKKNENIQKTGNLEDMLNNAKNAATMVKSFSSEAEKYYMFGVLNAFTAKAEARKAAS